ncbi:MAG: HypC/HybG/HupF family hydrogenase formation chaperone [Candidatus Hodarchaeales archaeon]
MYNFTMCLAIPAQVLEFLEDNLVLADFGRGVKREVSIALLGEKLSLGDWILIHTGEEIWRLEDESSHSSSSS